LAIVPLLFVQIPQPKREKQEKGIRAVLSDLAGGFEYAWKTKGIRYMMITIFVGTILMSPAFTFFPLLIRDHFGGDAMQLGSFQAVYALAGLGGAAVLVSWGGFRKKIYTSLGGTAIMGVGMTLLCATPPDLFPLALVAIGIVGFGLSIHSSPIQAIYQSVVPKEKQARLFAINGALVYGSIPIAMAVGGPIADTIGIRSVYYMAAAGFAFFIISRLLIPSIRNIEGEPVTAKK
jgi:MFS transporter, DHA3 family, macrolide efflux protein